MIRKLVAAAAVATALAGHVVPVAACGGLVAPNGAVRLARASTLVSWHDGVEHYMTSFTYQGDVTGLGWIVPLPAIPDKIEEGGAWTLQRLVRETHPVLDQKAALAPQLAAGSSAEVLQQTKVEALDITVLRGSGQAVVDWSAANGFILGDETRAHLLAYATSSPIFMAAKYDVNAARLRGQFRGDGAPVLITMRTPRLWVPLEVLANHDDPVNADLYLLTDEAPALSDVARVLKQSPVGAALPGAPGFTVQTQRQVSPSLYQDLSTDRNMGWVRPGGWLTYLSLDAPGHTVTYDMSITGSGVMRLATVGRGPRAADAPVEARFSPPAADSWRDALVVGSITVGSLAGAGLVAALVAAVNRRRRTRTGCV
jgi:hypothetical protein